MKTNKGGGESQERERESGDSDRISIPVVGRRPRKKPHCYCATLDTALPCDSTYRVAKICGVTWAGVPHQPLQQGGASHIQVNSIKGLKMMGHPVGGPAFSPLSSLLATVRLIEKTLKGR